MSYINKRVLGLFGTKVRYVGTIPHKYEFQITLKLF